MPQEKDKPVFVGKGITLPDEKSISISLCISDIPKSAIRNDGGREWVTLTLRPLKEPREKQTHSLRVYFPKER